MKPIEQRVPELLFLRWNKKVSRLLQSGRDVIRLDIGSPDLPPPRTAIQALTDSARMEGQHGYQPILGPDVLREAWADMYSRNFGVRLDPGGEVIPLQGSKMGVFLLTLAVVRPGDWVVVPDPGYPVYPAAAHYAGADIHRLPLQVCADSKPSLEEIPRDVAQRARLLWLNYPHNPTGATTNLEVVEECVAFAHAHNILLAYDAAYSQVTFDNYEAPSILQIPSASETAVEFNSLSKSHNMAGWRMGVVLGNRSALEAMSHLLPNLTSGAFLPIIEGATRALGIGKSWIERRNEIYQERRDSVAKALIEMDCEVVVPKAGIYVWSTTPGGLDSLEFASALLEDAGVSVTPGIAFGDRGEGHFRISLVASQTRIERAMTSLKRWWQAQN
jgi:LL-diaminopimelate aminotransferase